MVTPEDKLLIPAYGYNKTEKNLSVHNDVTLSIASKSIAGYKAMGTGFIVKGTTRFVKSGDTQLHHISQLILFLMNY